MKKLLLFTLAVVAVIGAFRWQEWRDWFAKGTVPQLTQEFSLSLIHI